MANKLTKRDIDKIIPPMDKEDAIEQTERYATEFENCKIQFEETMKKLRELYDKE